MYYSSIVENIARHISDKGGKLCLTDGKITLTYEETWKTICGFADALEKTGVKKGDCVVMECNQSVNFLIAYFAIQKIGAINVPLEKNAAVARVLEIAGDTDAVLHIANKAVEELRIPHIDISETTKKQIEVPLEDVHFPSGDDIAEILFSTGTTGKSKGIVLTHRNDVAIAENVINGVKMKPDNIEIIPMPMSHSHGLRRMYGNMVNGSSVVLLDGVTFVKKMFDLMDNYNVTSMDLSPSMLSIIFKLSRDKLGEYADVLDYVQLGSAPLGEEDKVHLSKILPNTRLYNFYGSTEAGCSCLMDFNEMSGKPGCIGRPATNAEFIVVDENRKEIKSSPENLGFLASSGDINMREYFKAPELTKEAMANGFIYTKDLGYIDEEGLVYMLGRKDDVINYGGVKISPEEVESVVMTNSWIHDCALIPIKDALTGQAPKLFIALEDDADYNEKEFKSFLQKELDANKQPKIIEIIDEIPRTFNGKIVRKDLANR